MEITLCSFGSKKSFCTAYRLMNLLNNWSFLTHIERFYSFPFRRILLEDDNIAVLFLYRHKVLISIVIFCWQATKDQQSHHLFTNLPKKLTLPININEMHKKTDLPVNQKIPNKELRGAFNLILNSDIKFTNHVTYGPTRILRQIYYYKNIFSMSEKRSFSILGLGCNGGLMLPNTVGNYQLYNNVFSCRFYIYRSI